MLCLKNLFLAVIILAISITLIACKPKSQLSQQTQPTQNQQSATKQDADFQASFAVFTDNVFRVFTASMYHNRLEDVFITAENPNVVNVKKSSITWGDFFNSLPMQLISDCLTTGTGEKFCNTTTKTLKFYVNGQKVNDFLDREIKPNDRALISFGEENDSQIQNQLKQIPTP